MTAEIKKCEKCGSNMWPKIIPDRADGWLVSYKCPVCGWSTSNVQTVQYDSETKESGWFVKKE